MNLSRRQFFKLGATAAVGAALPKLGLWDWFKGLFAAPSATIGQYADYMNLSDLALETAIDPGEPFYGIIHPFVVRDLLPELNYRASVSFDAICDGMMRNPKREAYLAHLTKMGWRDPREIAA